MDLTTQPAGAPAHGDVLPPDRSVHVDLSGPLDMTATLDFYRRHGDDLIDRWDGAVLVRTVPIVGRRVPLALRVEDTAGQAVAVATAPSVISSAELAQLGRDQFLHDRAALAWLAKHDHQVAGLLPRYGDIAILTQPDILHALVRCITAQQVNGAWAVRTRARLAMLVGKPLSTGNQTAYALEADRLAGCTVSSLKELQLSTRKAEYLIHAATAVADGQLDTAELADAPDEELLNRLTALRGIGTWSAEWMLIRVFRRARVVAGDLAVRKAIGWLYGIADPTEAQVRSLTMHWGSAAAVTQTAALEAHYHLHTQRGRL